MIIKEQALKELCNCTDSDIKKLNGNIPTYEYLANIQNAFNLVKLLPHEGKISQRAFAVLCTERIKELNVNKTIQEGFEVIRQRVNDVNLVSDSDLKKVQENINKIEDQNDIAFLARKTILTCAAIKADEAASACGLVLQTILGLATLTAKLTTVEFREEVSSTINKIQLGILSRLLIEYQTE